MEGILFRNRKDRDNSGNIYMKAWFPISILGSFVFMSVLLYLVGREFTKDYKEILHDHKFAGEVLNAYSYKGFSYVTLTNDQKYLVTSKC